MLICAAYGKLQAAYEKFHIFSELHLNIVKTKRQVE